MSGWLERTVWLVVGAILCVLILSALAWAIARQAGFDIPIQTLVAGVTSLLVWAVIAGPTRPAPRRQPPRPQPKHGCDSSRDCMEALTSANQLRAAGALTEREWLEIKAVHLPPGPVLPGPAKSRGSRA